MEKNEQKTNSIRKLGKIDVLPLLKILPLLKDEWDRDSEINPNKQYSLSQVNHVNFRWSEKKADPVRYFDLPLWPKFKDQLLPIMRETVQAYGYTKGFFPRVMLAKMNPGTLIPDHIDGKTRGWIPHKIHIPLITNPDVRFSIHGTSYHFPKGEAVEVDNSGMHGVENRGKTVRIHLIFEYLDGQLNNINYNDLE